MKIAGSPLLAPAGSGPSPISAKPSLRSTRRERPLLASARERSVANPAMRAAATTAAAASLA